jgi:hydroxymethylbilane synthase/uroporphyrinogen III methyltransferase/synthase
LSDADTKKATEVERAFLASTGGNCHLPIGAYLDTETNVFYSIFGNEEGTKLDIKKQDYVG